VADPPESQDGQTPSQDKQPITSIEKTRWDRKYSFYKNEPEKLLKIKGRTLKLGQIEPINKPDELSRIRIHGKGERERTGGRSGPAY
jgi:hypothetical protein